MNALAKQLSEESAVCANKEQPSLVPGVSSLQIHVHQCVCKILGNFKNCFCMFGQLTCTHIVGTSSRSPFPTVVPLKDIPL